MALLSQFLNSVWVQTMDYVPLGISDTATSLQKVNTMDMNFSMYMLLDTL